MKTIEMMDYETNRLIAVEGRMRTEMAVSWSGLTKMVDLLIDLSEQTEPQAAVAVGKYRFQRDQHKPEGSRDIVRTYEVFAEEGDQLAQVVFRGNTYISSEIDETFIKLVKEAITALRNMLKLQLQSASDRMRKERGMLNKILGVPTT